MLKTGMCLYVSFRSSLVSSDPLPDSCRTAADDANESNQIFPSMLGVSKLTDPNSGQE